MKNSDKRIMQVLGVLAFAMLTLGVAQDTGLSVDLAESSEHGQYLVDQDGMAFYLFAPDAQGPSTCYDDCATNWPPVTVESADALPTAGEGLDSALFGTIERDDGTFQVTYNGWPLYYYAGDMEAGTTSGQGLGNNWYVLDPMGTAIGMDGAAGEGAMDQPATPEEPAEPETPETPEDPEGEEGEGEEGGDGG